MFRSGECNPEQRHGSGTEVPHYYIQPTVSVDAFNQVFASGMHTFPASQTPLFSVILAKSLSLDITFLASLSRFITVQRRFPMHIAQT